MPTQLFDRTALRRQRERRARHAGFEQFLHSRVGEQLVDRLNDMRRRFDRALILGDHGGAIPALPSGVVVRADLARSAIGGRSPGGLGVVADEERLPFGPARFDLVISLLNLHWANDPVGGLVQLRRCLQPDGLFLGALLGGGTLAELRACLTEAEIAETGGAGPRVAPFAALIDSAAMLQRAGFALPVADGDELTVSYPSAMALLRDLRTMGEANVLSARVRHVSRRALFARAAALYEARHRDDDGRVIARFTVHYLTGWAPAPGQPQPLKRGSARQRLADGLASPGPGRSGRPGRPGKRSKPPS